MADRESYANIRDYIVERKKFFHGRETGGRLVALTIIARRHSSTPGERVMRGLFDWPKQLGTSNDTAKMVARANAHRHLCRV